MTKEEYLYTADVLQEAVNNGTMPVDDATELNELAYNQYIESVIEEEEYNDLMSEIDPDALYNEATRWKEELMKSTYKAGHDARAARKAVEKSTAREVALKGYRTGAGRRAQRAGDEAAAYAKSVEDMNHKAYDNMREALTGDKTNSGRNAVANRARDLYGRVKNAYGISDPDSEAPRKPFSEMTPQELKAYKRSKKKELKQFKANKQRGLEKKTSAKVNPLVGQNNTTRTYKYASPDDVAKIRQKYADLEYNRAEARRQVGASNNGVTNDTAGKNNAQSYLKNKVATAGKVGVAGAGFAGAGASARKIAAYKEELKALKNKAKTSRFGLNDAEARRVKDLKKEIAKYTIAGSASAGAGILGAVGAYNDFKKGKTK